MVLYLYLILVTCDSRITVVWCRLFIGRYNKPLTGSLHLFMPACTCKVSGHQSTTGYFSLILDRTVDKRGDKKAGTDDMIQSERY